MQVDMKILLFPRLSQHCDFKEVISYYDLSSNAGVKKKKEGDSI